MFSTKWEFQGHLCRQTLHFSYHFDDLSIGQYPKLFRPKKTYQSTKLDRTGICILELALLPLELYSLNKFGRHIRPFDAVQLCLFLLLIVGWDDIITRLSVLGGMSLSGSWLSTSSSSTSLSTSSSSNSFSDSLKFSDDIQPSKMFWKISAISVSSKVRLHAIVFNYYIYEKL